MNKKINAGLILLSYTLVGAPLSALFLTGCGGAKGNATIEVQEPDHEPSPPPAEVLKEMIPPTGFIFGGGNSNTDKVQDGLDTQRLIQNALKADPKLSKKALKKAFDYYLNYQKVVKNRKYLTIVNFDQPSTERRMVIINTVNGEVVTALVAHGKNSGQLYAEDFSNVSGSLKSSVGIYVTGSEYNGDNGESLRLNGMESTNSNAFSRSIVMHGSKYVSPAIAKANGQIGRSWGCLAMERGEAAKWVGRLKNGSVIFAYSTGSDGNL